MVCRSVTRLSSAKTAKVIKVPFALRTRLGPRKHVLDIAVRFKPNAVLWTFHTIYHLVIIRLHRSWLRGTAVECLSLAGELSLSSARPAAGG